MAVWRLFLTLLCRETGSQPEQPSQKYRLYTYWVIPKRPSQLELPRRAPPHILGNNMSKLAVRILPVTLADNASNPTPTDLETLYAIETATFQLGRSAEDTIFNQLMFGLPSAVRQSQYADEVRTKLENQPSCRIYKAVLIDEASSIQEEPEERIVGFASWNFYDPKHPPPTRVGPGNNEQTSPQRPQIHNDFFGALAGKREHFMGKGRFAHLETLAVLPSYQGLGIGSELLNVGLEEADRRGIPVWVESTPEAYSLYQSCGFSEMVGVPMDLTEYGEKGVVTTYCMLRPKLKR